MTDFETWWVKWNQSRYDAVVAGVAKAAWEARERVSSPNEPLVIAAGLQRVIAALEAQIAEQDEIIRRECIGLGREWENRPCSQCEPNLSLASPSLIAQGEDKL